MKKFFALLCSSVLVFSTTSAIYANDYSVNLKSAYEKAYEQDQDLIKELNEKMPELLKKGQELSKNDPVKGNERAMYGNSMGTYGDILVSLIIDSGSVGFAGHAAIVSNDSNKTVESYTESFSPINKDGVQYYDNNWGNQSKALLVRPNNATTSQYSKAADYAESQVGKPYNWNFFDKDTEEKFYCSQLVWKAWLDAGINCEPGSIPNGIIAPADLVNSKNTYIVRQNS